MADINIGKAPATITVLPFYGTAAVFLWILTLFMAIEPYDLLVHYFSPHLLAWVHTAALGWATMMIFGAAYQLLPVICEQDLYSTRLALWSYGLLTTGVCILIFSFWNFWTGIPMIIGGSFILLAACCYAFNVWQTAAPCSDKYTVHKCFLISAACWLVLTVSIGLLLAINLRYPFIPRNHLELVKLHAHLGLVGWFLQLIVGVSVKLIPMFLLGKSNKNYVLRIALVLQNMGLILFLVDGYLVPTNKRSLIYGVLVLLGVLAWGYYLADAFRNRARKKIDIPMKHVFFSFGYLLAAFLLLPVMEFRTETKWVTLYGILLFLGWITALILGKTFKTLPFIVWNKRYKKLNGKVKVPLPKQLYSEQLVTVQYYLYHVACSLLLTGIVFTMTWLLQLSTILWLLMSTVYLYNVAKVLFHKQTKPLWNYK